MTIEELGKKMDDLHDEFKDEFNKIRKHLYGNGEGVGLVTRLDRLEQAEENRKWHFRTLYTSTIGIVGKLFYDLVHK